MGNVKQHPILHEGKTPPFCGTVGCTYYAEYLCIWGCLEGDVHSGFYCNPCAASKSDRVIQNENRHGRMMICVNGHLIDEFVQINLKDQWRDMHNHHGVKVYYD